MRKWRQINEEVKLCVRERKEDVISFFSYGNLFFEEQFLIKKPETSSFSYSCNVLFLSKARGR